MNAKRASLLGIAASATSAVALFIVFRLSVELLGVVTLGTWVLVQSVFVISRAAEGGVGVNLTRIYAVDRAACPGLSPSPYFGAGIVLVVLPALAIGALVAIPAVIMIGNDFAPTMSGPVLRSLVCAALITSIVTAVSSVAMSTVEGAGLLSLRHVGAICANITLAVVAYPLCARFGVLGLALTYLIAAVVNAVIGLVLLFQMRRGSLAVYAVGTLVGRIKDESLRAFGIALLRTGFEPWTKFLVAIFGSVGGVAALDLAFRVTTQVRVLIQSATQPLLFIGARSESRMSEAVLASYTAASHLVVRANWVGLIGLASVAPLISSLGFGSVSPLTVWFVILLSVANALNSMGVVGYYAEVSMGSLGELLKIHMAMAMINITAGLMLGWVGGALGVVSAYSVAFIYGGLALLKLWGKQSKTSIWEIVQPGGVLIVLSALSVSWAAFSAVFQRPATLTIIMSIAIGGSLVSISLFQNRNIFRRLVDKPGS